jgi:hypothetical protein
MAAELEPLRQRGPADRAKPDSVRRLTKSNTGDN